MKKDPVVFLEHILDSIEKIEITLKNISQEQFSEEFGLQDIVIRRIAIIGEASANLPAEFRKKHPEIHWKDIKAMRNILVHEYFGIRVKKVWNVSRHDIPDLKKKVMEILAAEQQTKKLL